MNLVSIPSLPTDNWIVDIRYWNKRVGELLVGYLLLTTSLEFIFGWYYFFARPFLPERDDEDFDDED